MDEFTLYTEAGDGLNGRAFGTMDDLLEAVRTKYGADCHESITDGVIVNDAGELIGNYAAKEARNG